LRNGLKFNDKNIKLFYPKPASQLNPKDQANYAANIFSVTQELIYTKKHHKEIDLVIFLNGLPILTSELKNPLTGQNYQHAIKQYRSDRDPQDTLLNFGRCLVHFALDTDQAYMTTKLAGQETYFLPFNQGLNQGKPKPPYGKGNPDNPEGLKTSYMWQQVLTKDSLSEIIAKYSQFITEQDQDTGKKKTKLIFPRYHQLDAVGKLINHTKQHGVGQRYLIQHSTGSGKSFSIVWLTYQLANLFNSAGQENIFDSVIIVTDRRNLDENIKEQLKSFAQIKNLVAAIGGTSQSKSEELKEALLEGKKIIVVTVQTFPFVLEKIQELPSSNYAIVIDEAHSSQSGATAAQMNAVLSNEEVEQITRDTEGNIQTEDYINALIKRRKMLSNASYYAFTATPKNKTLETFGLEDSDGKFYPFHLYPMKQAIEEGFIVDVLQNYTSYTSYYKLTKDIADNPEFDVKQANKKLRSFVEAHPSTVARKAEIMINHFHNDVAHLIDGQARAMVVTKSIHSAMKYKDAFDDYLSQINSPFEAIVAFSGSKKHYRTGEELTEIKMNRFEDGINDITYQFKKDKYRFLIVAEKFQTGFDEPLLHTMYVDKRLSGLQAVQTLSRLNRSHPAKQDTFVLDFYNEPEEIKKAFQPYYTGTVLSEATDPNKLNDLQEELEAAQVYTKEDVDRFFESLISGASRDILDPQLDALVKIFDNLSKEQKVEFKSKAKTFVRTYGYLSKIIDFEKAHWEKLYWLLKNLVTKLYIEGVEEDEADILEAVDIDSFRPSKVGKNTIYLDDSGEEIEPIPLEDGSHIEYTVEKDTLENIINEFNKRFGNIKWNEPDKVEKTLSKDIPAMMKEDTKTIESIRKSDRQNAQVAANKKLRKTILGLVKSNAEIYNKFQQDENFRQNYQDFIFEQLWQESKGAGNTHTALKN
jgi:type I restriction enzyme R subunit